MSEFPGRTTLIRSVQDELHLKVDGDDGPRTWKAIALAVGVASHFSTADIPRDTDADIIRVYGPPGQESSLVRFTFPYRMRLYETGPVISGHRCHRLCKSDLEAILEEARDELGMDFIQAHGLDTYHGCFDDRPMRGSSSRSRHSWGIAIDIAAHRNEYSWPWPGRATMPVEFIEIFERHGWKSGARAWGRDAMHFQRTQ